MAPFLIMSTACFWLAPALAGMKWVASFFDRAASMTALASSRRLARGLCTITFMPLLQGRDRDGRVGVVRRHHLDRGHVLLLVQQLAEVGVGGAPLVVVLAPLLRVVGLDDLLADVAAAGHVVEAFSPGRVADEPPDPVPDLVLAPFQVMGPVLLDVADGDDLHVRAGEDAADLPDRLGAEADAGQGDLLAGRDEPRPAQHVSRHDGEGRRGRAAGEQEVATRESARRSRAVRLVPIRGRRILGFHEKTSEFVRGVSARNMCSTGELHSQHHAETCQWDGNLWDRKT